MCPFALLSLALFALLMTPATVDVIKQRRNRGK